MSVNWQLNHHFSPTTVFLALVLFLYVYGGLLVKASLSLALLVIPSPTGSIGWLACGQRSSMHFLSCWTSIHTEMILQANGEALRLTVSIPACFPPCCV
jgi:sensor histidine kinase YesM